MTITMINIYYYYSKIKKKKILNWQSSFTWLTFFIIIILLILVDEIVLLCNKKFSYIQNWFIVCMCIEINIIGSDDYIYSLFPLHPFEIISMPSFAYSSINHDNHMGEWWCYFTMVMADVWIDFFIGSTIHKAKSKW